MPVRVERHPDQLLRPDGDRVIGRLFLPSTEPPHVHRASDLVARVLELSEAEVDELLPGVLSRFSPYHHDLPGILQANARAMAAHYDELSPARTLLLGAAFTSEYSPEGAALCNPSVVPHPDQSGLAPGQLRVAVPLRGIGEGHHSTLVFATAIVSDTWEFQPRAEPAVPGRIVHAPIPRSLFSVLLGHTQEHDELTQAVLNLLPDEVLAPHVETALADVHPDLLLQPKSRQRATIMRHWSRSGYEVSFDEGTLLDQRVLPPAADDESFGLEDARFTHFSDPDGTSEYRATYTAFDGRRISNRLLTSPDLMNFRSFPLTGPGASNKGMALFPRRIDGRFAALSRADGIHVGVTYSEDGLVWESPTIVEGPRWPWQILQTGNGSPPVEVDDGWLVVTHGVGFLRAYSLGAMLLDRDDPTRVIARLDGPLLTPDEHAGYVPNVVFTCGSIVHRGRLFIPYGIGDAWVSVASVGVDELIGSMTRLANRATGPRPRMRPVSAQ